MLKFLRKYNKFLLAGFGTVLLLTWLAPSAITQWSRQDGASGVTWATLGDGTRLTLGDLQDLQRQIKVLDALQMPLMRQLGGSDDPSLWYLLAMEARDAGLVGGVGEGQSMLRQIAGSSPPEQLMRSLTASSGLPPQAVLQTLATAQGVMRLLAVAARAPRLSEARLEAKAIEAMTGVSAEIVVLSSDKPLPGGDPVPTAERMQAILKEFAAVEPGAGRSGMGLRQPAKASLEWFSVPVSTVRTSLESDPRLSGVELRKAFLKDPVSYGAAASDPNPSFDAFRAQVRDRELDRLASARMDEIAKFIADQSQLGLRGLPREGPYVRLGEAATPSQDLSAVASTVSRQFGLGALSVQRTPLGPVASIAAVPGLGGASTTRFGNRPMPTDEVVMQARELKPETPRAVVQAGVVGPVMRGTASATGQASDIYAFRIVEAVPAHDASGVDEVREQLELDTLRTMRFETMEARRQEIEAEARKGLAPLAQAWGSKVDLAPSIREADSNLLLYGLRMPAAVPGLKPDEKLSKAIVTSALSIPGDLATATDADRVFVVASPANMALVAYRVLDLLPVYREDFASMASNPRQRDAVAGTLRDLALGEAFSVMELRRRHGFQLSRDDEATDKAEPTADKAG